MRDFAAKPAETPTNSQIPAPGSDPANDSASPSSAALLHKVRKVRPSPLTGRFVLTAALIVAIFWVGCAFAWMIGYAGLSGLAALGLQTYALFGAALIIPPVLIMATAWALERGQAMSQVVSDLGAKIEFLATADESSAKQAAKLGRAVRHELDALNAGIDGAFQRLRALENVLQGQITALDEAGARADMRGESVANRLSQERERLESLSALLGDAASKAGDDLADHSQELKALIESTGQAFGQSTSRAHDLLAEKVGHLKSLIESAGDVLLDGTIRAHELLTERTERANDLMASRVTQMKSVIESSEGALDRAAGLASEHLAGRVAQLQSIMESAEGQLAAASQALEQQTSTFRASLDAAAQAPHNSALELDKQAKQIEQVSDAALARAEFVLGRHERHRNQLGELLQKLRDEGVAFDTALTQQRQQLQQAISSLAPETQRIVSLTEQTEQQIDKLLGDTALKTDALHSKLHQDADHLNVVSAQAAEALAKVAHILGEAGTSAQALISSTTHEAKSNANAMVGEAMEHCERLIAAAGQLSGQSKEVSHTLQNVIGDIQNHMVNLPVLAQQEAEKLRDVLRGETEQMLDLSARTAATMHARSAQRLTKDADPTIRDSENLLARARKLASRPKRGKGDSGFAEAAESKTWQMSALLAAVDTREKSDRALRPATAAALGALEAALADQAIDLSSFDTSTAPGAASGTTSGEDEWRRYLAGDRTVFARRLADAMDSDAMNRITNLYRENASFRDAADQYIGDFENLLQHAREGDGGGLLTSTLLSADTGKIYLALSYALGRLS